MIRALPIISRLRCALAWSLLSAGCIGVSTLDWSVEGGGPFDFGLGDVARVECD
jgi:hypothetical protein